MQNHSIQLPRKVGTYCPVDRRKISSQEGGEGSLLVIMKSQGLGGCIGQAIVYSTKEN